MLRTITSYSSVTLRTTSSAIAHVHSPIIHYTRDRWRNGYFEYSILPSTCLDVGRVEHDSDGRAKGLGGQVVSESGSDNAGVSVGSSNLAPHDSDLGASDLLVGSVDVSNSLSDVELGLVGVGDALNLDERNVGVHNSFASLVRDMLSLNVDCVSMVVKRSDNIMSEMRRVIHSWVPRFLLVCTCFAGFV